MGTVLYTRLTRKPGTRVLRRRILSKRHPRSAYALLPSLPTNQLTNPSKLVPHARRKSLGRTGHPRPAHHCPRPLHPGPQRPGPAAASGQEYGPGGSAAESEAGGYVALGAVGEAGGGEFDSCAVAEGDCFWGGRWEVVGWLGILFG